MGLTVYSLAIAISIVILCLSAGIVAVIRARSKYGDKSDLIKSANNKLGSDGLTGRGVPITREEFKACRGTQSSDSTSSNVGKPSYREALLVEQINTALVSATINLNNASRLIVENQDEKSFEIRESLTNNFDGANECYLNVLDRAAYWHFKGLISVPVFVEMYLDIIVPTYEGTPMAKKYKNLTYVYEGYRTVFIDREIRKKEK